MYIVLCSDNVISGNLGLISFANEKYHLVMVKINRIVKHLAIFVLKLSGSNDDSIGLFQ